MRGLGVSVRGRWCIGRSVLALIIVAAASLSSTFAIEYSAAATSALTVTTTSLPSGTMGSAYYAVLSASGGTAPYRWSLIGFLPSGLTFNPTSGTITGTPTKVGKTKFTVKVTSATLQSATAALSITVDDAPSSPPPPPSSPPPPTPPAPTASGYDLVGSDGGVFVFPTISSVGFFGSLPGLGVSVNDIVGMVPTANDQGYFLVGSDGGLFAFGNAPFLGSLPGALVTPAQPITGVVPTGTDQGYFLVAKDGGVFAFGNAPFMGSLPSIGVHRDDIIGIAATPSGNGYWLVATTGTVYAFGAAQNLGSATGTTSPVSAIAGTSDGGGYWIVTQNGAVSVFGDAKGLGTLPADSVTPVKPIIGIVRCRDTNGYWLIGADGGIFAFGDAGFVGSLPGLGVGVTDIVGAVSTTA